MDKGIKSIIMGLKKWMTYLAIAMAGVEKTALGQRSKELDSQIGKYQRHTKGDLADSLIHGEVTQEVLNLKWRTYKILQAVDGYKTEVSYDEDGNPITNTYMVDRTLGLSKIKMDEYDSFPLE